MAGDAQQYTSTSVPSHTRHSLLHWVELRAKGKIGGTEQDKVLFLGQPGIAAYHRMQLHWRELATQ